MMATETPRHTSAAERRRLLNISAGRPLSRSYTTSVRSRIVDPHSAGNLSITVTSGQSAGRNLSDEPPTATLSATEPSRDTGCSATVRAEPPIRTLAPAPSPMPTSPDAPTYSPASAPAGIPTVGASTAQPRTPPALMPRSIPTVLSAPSYACGGPILLLGTYRHSIDWWPAMMKPMLGLSLHVNRPTCAQFLGAWADAGAVTITASTANNDSMLAFIVSPNFNSSSDFDCIQDNRCGHPSLSARNQSRIIRRRDWTPSCL